MAQDYFPDVDRVDEGIAFHSEDREVPDFLHHNPSLISRWISIVAGRHQCSLGSLHIHFCSDHMLLHMNKTFLDHDYYTDILTFPEHDRHSTSQLSGDLYISVDRLEENAKKHEETFEDECLRVIIHGVLHLSGQDDRSKKEQENMHQLENKALELYFKLNDAS